MDSGGTDPFRQQVFTSLFRKFEVSSFPGIQFAEKLEIPVVSKTMIYNFVFLLMQRLRLFC